LVTRDLQHAEDHILLLGRRSSFERVAAFLLEMDKRMAAPSEMILPMKRFDIADYLGLALETVSRTLSSLR
jgi:CRP/FNR family nitrogen fixation transcriptional regulator